MTDLDPWQLELDGLLIGAGTDYRLHRIVGLYGSPEVRAADQDREGLDGVHAGRDTTGPRTVTLAVEFEAADVEQLLELTEPLAAAATRADGLTTKLLRWQMPGQTTRRLNVRPRRSLMPDLDRGVEFGVGTASIELFAPDPDHLADEADLLTLTLAPTVLSTSDELTHDGTGHAHPTIIWTGPTRNPRLTNSTTGRALRLDLDVGPGEVLEVDFAARTVRLDGTDRYAAVRADHEWWRLAPGDNVLVASRAGSGLSGGQADVDVVWRDTWAG